MSIGKNQMTGTVSSKVDDYLTVYGKQKSDAERKEEFQSKGEGGKVMTNHYYDLVTDFYEYGWGERFHFSTLNKGESRDHSFAKHEYRLALKLGIEKGETVLVS
jgi:sterol 24-C-methyltransferase